jgi:hypothetical protein
MHLLSRMRGIFAAKPSALEKQAMINGYPESWITLYGSLASN